MNQIDYEVRRDICEGCACEADLRDPCAVCPKGKWGAVDCPEGPGTVAARFIEEHILQPLERTGPAGAALAQAARRCGGCKADAARLDGKGGGSAI